MQPPRRDCGRQNFTHGSNHTPNTSHRRRHRTFHLTRGHASRRIWKKRGFHSPWDFPASHLTNGLCDAKKTADGPILVDDQARPLALHRFCARSSKTQGPAHLCGARALHCRGDDSRLAGIAQAVLTGAWRLCPACHPPFGVLHRATLSLPPRALPSCSAQSRGKLPSRVLRLHNPAPLKFSHTVRLPACC